jgi:hypothetical protein
MTSFQSFRKWCSLPIALFISLGLVFLRIEEPVKKPVKYCSGYSIIDSATIKDCNGKILKVKKVYHP